MGASCTSCPRGSRRREHAEIAPDGRLTIVEEESAGRAVRRGFGGLETGGAARHGRGLGLSHPPPPGPSCGKSPRSGQKSLTNRALVAAALAEGESELLDPLGSTDTRALASALELLGAGIS